VSNRSEYYVRDSQDMALVITIRDTTKSKPVYNEVVQLMNRAGWMTADIEVKERIRARI
jgi:hypothetical protein